MSLLFATLPLSFSSIFSETVRSFFPLSRQSSAFPLHSHFVLVLFSSISTLSCNDSAIPCILFFLFFLFFLFLAEERINKQTEIFYSLLYFLLCSLSSFFHSFIHSLSSSHHTTLHTLHTHSNERTNGRTDELTSSIIFFSPPQ